MFHVTIHSLKIFNKEKSKVQDLVNAQRWNGWTTFTISLRPTDDDKRSKQMATLLCEIFILPLRFKSHGIKVKKLSNYIIVKLL